MENLDKMLKKEMQPPKWVRRTVPLAMAVVLVLSIAFCTYLYIGTRTTMRERAIRNLINICELNEDSLDRAFQNREKLLRMISSRLSRKGIYEVDDILDELQEVATTYDCYQAAVLDENLTLYRTNGEVLDVSDMELAKRAWDTEPYISGSYFPPGNDKYMVNLFTCPVFKGKELKYVLLSTYYSKDLTSRMNINSLQGKGYTFLLDQQGRAVITPQQYNNQKYTDLMDYLDESPEITPAENTDLYFTYKGEKYYGRCEKLQVNDWYLMTCAREADVFAEARVITRSAFTALHMMWVFIACAILFVVYANYHFRRDLRQSHYYDEMLEIANINALDVYFQRTPREELEKLYLIVMDVDRFREFNYIYGNDRGDKLLQYIARVLQEELPQTLQFHYDSDSFIILDACQDDARLADNMKKTQDRFAQDIAAGIIEPFDTSGGVRKVEAGVPLRQLISDAVFARNQIRGNYLLHHAFYDGSLRENRLRYMEMESAFDTALKKREFQVYYQPKYDMGTGKIVGAEALARWVKPDGTIISPGMFIPCFEASRQICQLDEYILSEVCRHIRAWTERGGGSQAGVGQSVPRTSDTDRYFPEDFRYHQNLRRRAQISVL